jgi:tetratricopeptide (TPR) repeat protein
MNDSDEQYDLFISYNHSDEPWASKLAARLEQEDWQGRKLKVFFAPWNIRPGQHIAESIEDALTRSRYVGLVVTPEALQSEWVKVERLDTTHLDIEERRRRLIPLYRRRSDKLPPMLRGIKAIDFEDDARFEEAYRELRAVVRDEPPPRGAREPAPNAAPPTPPEIPRPPVVGFVARHDEHGRAIVEQLKEELAPHKNQLVSLWGSGGVGKTTLAAEAMRGLSAAGQRIFWVSADGRTNFTLSTLLDDIAAQLNRTDLRPLALEPKGEAVRALLADAPSLIVLDNFETISPEEQPPCVDFLAQRARCPALITTREWLEGTFSIPLRPMLPGEAEVFLNKLVKQTRDPGIYTEAVRRRLLATAERNPLIIQWVVGQINLAQNPDDVLDELAHGEGSAAHRVFDRSFDLPQMAEGGRAVLLALSLFMPSATRTALAEVAGMGKDKDKKKFRRAQQTLASLWLLNQTDGGQRLAVEGLTRELAKARLARDPRSKIFRPRFIARHLRYAEAHSEATAEHLNAIEREKDNIFNAIDVAAEVANWGSMLRLSHAITKFLDLRGYWDEAIGRGEQALKAARDIADEEWVSVLTHNTAMTYQKRGALVEARRLYGESLEIATNLGNKRGLAETLHQLGWLAQEQGDLTEARRLYDESLELKKNLGDQSGIASTLHQLGGLAQDQGDLTEARRLYNESLEIAKKLGDQRGIACTLHQLGTVSFAEGNLQEAESLFNQSRMILEKLKDKNNIATCLASIGDLKVAQGSLAEARSLFDEALQIVEALLDKSGIASVKRSLGLLAEKEGDSAGAAGLLREAVGIFEELGSPKAGEARGDLERVEGKRE